MASKAAGWRRWAVFGPCAAASVLPALLLTAAWAQPGRYAPTFLAFWAELLVGPVKYWLLGHPGLPALHPMQGSCTWVYGVCLPLALAHPLRPHVVTGCVTAAAFGVWYGWAFLTLNAFEY